MNFLFGSFWIIPVYIATRVFNCLWWQDIADALYKVRPNVNNHQYRTSSLSSDRDASPELVKWSLSMLLTDMCYAITIDTFFLIQATIFSLLPFGILSFVISTLHLSLLYALYAFEYIWWAQRCDAKDRMIRIQSNVPYFIGFGLPLALVSSAHDWPIINGCLYSVLFPFLILSAFEANPPLNGNSTKGSTQFPVFTPVITISEFVFGIFRKRSNFKAYLVSDPDTM